MLSTFVGAALLRVTTAATSVAPTLQIHLEPALSVEDTARLLAACSNAYAVGTCAEAQPGSASEVLSGRVELADPERVLIQVNLVDGENRQGASRELTFVPEDAPGDRAKAIGLSLGVVAAELVEEATPPVAPPEKPKPAPRPAAVETPVAAPRWLLALLGGAGRDPAFSAFEWGLAGRVEYGERASLWALRGGVAGFHASSDSQDLALWRLDPSVGIGIKLAFGSFDATGALDVGVEWQRATASDPSGDSDDASRVLPLARASVALRGYIAPSFGLEIDAQANFTTSSTSIFVRDREVEATSGFQGALLGGAFVAF